MPENIDLNIDRCSNWYKGGMAAGYLTQIATAAGGALLRRAVSDGATRAAVRQTGNAGAAAARRAAVRRGADTTNQTFHHRNTILGHPAVTGGRGSRSSLFPSGGSRFANHPRNFVMVDSAKHAALHQRAYMAELAAYYGSHPGLTASTAAMNFGGGCP